MDTDSDTDSDTNTEHSIVKKRGYGKDTRKI